MSQVQAVCFQDVKWFGFFDVHDHDLSFCFSHSVSRFDFVVGEEGAAVVGAMTMVQVTAPKVSVVGSPDPYPNDPMLQGQLA